MTRALSTLVFILSFWPAPQVHSQNAAAELAKLQPSINNAIDRGVAYLLKMQQRDGSFNFGVRQYHVGASSLAVYTLLKSGLPVEHSAVRRGLLYITQEIPKETYSAGCFMMAMAATGKPEYTAKVEPVLRELLKWQSGSWSYPSGVRDLSNTQYAALGLRVAAKLGYKIDGNVWAQLVGSVFKYQEKEQFLDDKGAKGYSGVTRVGAGFRYRAEGSNPVTGSMTAAGIGTLQIARECGGDRLGVALERQVQTSIDWGVNWLGANFSVTANPRKEQFYYYYMYGLERVGSLLKITDIGSHNWYLEGARELVKRQAEDGHWEQYGGESIPDTCFTLLFLERASAVVTGVHEGEKRTGQFSSSNVADDFRLRASGGTDGTPLALWVDPFPAKLVAAYADDAALVKGLRILKVEYEVNDKVVAVIPGNPKVGWTNEDYAAQYSLPRRGIYKVKARATLVDPKAPADASEPVTILNCSGFDVNAAQVHEEWMDAAARARTTDLVLQGGARAQASSEQYADRNAASAIDGFDATCWTYKPTDKDPWITVILDKPVHGDTIILSQMNGIERHRGEHDRITQVKIKLNGAAKPLEVSLDEDELKPTVVSLPDVAELHRIEVAVTGRVSGSKWPGYGGFAEIAVENRSKSKKPEPAPKK